jgi:large repetitive protein
VGAGVVTLSGAEAAGEPQCGETITADTTLHHDLIDCPNNGIVIGADDVTLDLNGHLVDGDGTENSGCDPNTAVCDTGLVDDGHDGVTVKHGRVREFAVGVLFGKSTPGRVRHNRVLGVSSAGNQFNGLGIFSSARSLVRNSSGSGSGAPGEDGVNGMFLADSHHVRVLDNSFQDNGDDGIFVADSTHNLIKGNLFSRNKSGIVFEKSDRNRVRRNRFVRENIGVDLGAANRNVIARNQIVHAINRPGRPPGQAITVCCASHNVIVRNSVRDTEGTAIKLGFAGGVGNAVRRNHIHGAGKDGVHVIGKAKHTLLKGNHAFGAKDDGLDTNSPTTELTRNEAGRNGDLGIEAVRGVIDRGGNIARHNGDPRQCTNIACS